MLRHVFGLHGIEAKHWEAIRQTAFREVNGLTYLTPDRIADLPNAAIRPLAQERVSALSAAGKLTPTAERRILDERVYGAARLVFLRVSA